MESKNENTLQNNTENNLNLTPNKDKNELTESNKTILGLKRERETDETIENEKNDNKKTKTEDSNQISTENSQQFNLIQQPKILNNQYQTNGYNIYNNNANLVNQSIQMQQVYGYPAQPQLYYYNQPQIPPLMTGHPYMNQRYPMNTYQANPMYPGAFNYPHTAIPPSHLYPQAVVAPTHNPYVTNYSQSVLNQSVQEKQKYVIKDYPEITVGGYLQSKNLKEQYLSSIKPKDESISVNDAVNSSMTESEAKEVNFDSTNTSDLKSKNNVVNNFLTPNKNNNLNINTNNNLNTNANNHNNVVLGTKYSQPQTNSSINLNFNIGTYNQTQKSPNIKTNLANILYTPYNKKPTDVAQNENSNVKSNLNNLNQNTKNINNNANEDTSTKPNLIVNNDDFSESLQDFIMRAYDKCKNDLDKKKCKKALLKIITAGTIKGDLRTRDFSKFPLPVLPSEEKEETQKILEEMQNKKITNLNNKNTNSNNIVINSFFKNNKQNEKNITIKTYNNINININNNINNTSNKNYNNTNYNFNKDNSTLNNLNSLEELTKNTIIIGTCQELEKQYLRLTTLPDPSQVRPENVLKKSLKMLKEKWKKKEHEYNYFDEQFRSIRQDMTIQHIQNEFTVKVYEINARIALECHDIDQFNQCQTKLINLYESGIKGKETEFLAYRIIYMGLHKIKYDMEYLLKRLRKDNKMKNTCEIEHALKIHRVLNDNNFFEFFKLYKIAPNMSSYLIEPFLPRIRVKSLEMMSIAYFTEIEIETLTKRLAFDNKEDCIKFLESNKLKLNNEKTKFLCKESLPALKASDIALSKHITSNL